MSPIASLEFIGQLLTKYITVKWLMMRVSSAKLQRHCYIFCLNCFHLEVGVFETRSIKT